MAELLDTMSDTVEMLSETARENDSSQFTNLLTDQQDVAMVVGEQIDASEGEGTKGVQMLEQYCELIYTFSMKVINCEADVFILERRLN